MIFKSSVAKNKAQQYLDVFKAAFEQSVLEDQTKGFSFALVGTHGVRLDMGASMAMLESVAICYRTEKGAFVSLFSPYAPYMENTPNFHQFMAEARLSGQDMINLRQAFELPEDVTPWVIDHVYEPTEKDINNAEYVSQLLPMLLSRLYMEAGLDEMVKGGSLDESPVVSLLSPDQRPLNMEITYRFGDGTSKNIMDLPVRDDYILTLSCIDEMAMRRQDPNTRRGMGTPKIYFLEVSGYIDFRLAAADNSSGKPWNPQRERYVPEFIITAINQVSDANVADGSVVSVPLHDAQANFIGAAMVAKFMRSGAWTERLAKELGSNRPTDVLVLTPKDLAESVSTAVRGESNEIARVFNQLLEPGFLVSMDVDGNALDDYSMAPVKLTMQDSNYLSKVALPLMRYTFTAGHSYGNSKPKLSDYEEGYRSHPVHMAGLFVDKGFYRRVSFGRLSMQYLADIRYIDALAAFHLNRQDPAPANRYMDAFYPNRGSGFSAPNPMDSNRKTRRAFQQEQTDVQYMGVAERITLAPEFLHELQQIIERCGGSMEVVTNEPRRPTVYSNSMTAF